MYMTNVISIIWIWMYIIILTIYVIWSIRTYTQELINVLQTVTKNYSNKTHLFKMLHFRQQNEVDVYKPCILTGPGSQPIPRLTITISITRILRTVNVHFQPSVIPPVTSTAPTYTFGNKLLPNIWKAMLHRPRTANAGASRPCSGVGLWPEAFLSPLQFPLSVSPSISWLFPFPFGYHS